MSLKIEQSCDWCATRAQVKLPTSGPLDLSKIGLPDGWVSRPAFPHSSIGDQASQELCTGCDGQWDDVLQRAQQAYDGVLSQAIKIATAAKAPVAVASGRSSSFARG